MSSSSRCAGPEPGRRGALRWLLASAPLIWAPAALHAAAAARAVPAEVQAEFEDARLQGSGRLRFFGLTVYDIRLWTPAPLGGSEALDARFALEIEYARPLAGVHIAERSLAEMQRGAGVDAADGQRWLIRMKQLFPNVRAGDRITGLHRPREGARFHLNGRFLGEVRDAEFARRFFGIWLAPETSEPQLRAALLGIER